MALKNKTQADTINNERVYGTAKMRASQDDVAKASNPKMGRKTPGITHKTGKISRN